MVSNWHELSMYFSQFAIASKSAKAEPSSAQQGDVLEPPKEEEELVQLNVALQKEIVRFTASGIRQALRAMESTDSSRTSSGRTSASGPFIIFVR